MTSGKYFNRAVIALDAPHIGYVVRETEDKIVVFGDGKERYDIPLSEIQTVSKNVLIGLNFDEIAKKYSVDRNSPLPTSKFVDLGITERMWILHLMKINFPNHFSTRV
jgi:hypothetical protein